jgi:carbon storage regulator
MLVLTRRRNEKIIIDGNIEIEVVRLQGDRVRLGITAPKEVSIQRQEVRERIDRERSGGVQSGHVVDEPPLPATDWQMPVTLQGPVAL